MLDLFKNVKELLEPEKVKIDNQIFRLHYIFTVLILLVFTIIVSTKQLAGTPIECAHTKDLPNEIINTYCWLGSTYVIIDAFDKEVGKDIPFPGIDSTQDESKFVYQKYYQWVAFVLLFQAALFYSPRWFWYSWEGGKINALLMDLHVGLAQQEEKDAKKNLLAEYFMCSWNTHNWYAARYLICEMICLINVLGQIFLLNIFLDGQFFSYGLNVMHFVEKNNTTINPMVKLFPRITKCRFFRYGQSGGIETFDAICLMALNIINEKIYIFLWFWFLLLIVFTSCTICVHILLFMSPLARAQTLCRRFGFDRKRSIFKLVRKASFGDWFLIYMIGQNMDFVIFRDLVEEIAMRIDSEVKVKCESSSEDVIKRE